MNWRTQRFVIKNPSSRKLTEAQVKEIRKQYDSNELNQKQIAIRFGISQAMVSDIVTKRAWSEVK